MIEQEARLNRIVQKYIERGVERWDQKKFDREVRTKGLWKQRGIMIRRIGEGFYQGYYFPD